MSEVPQHLASRAKEAFLEWLRRNNLMQRAARGRVKVFVTRNAYAQRTPRKCFLCLVPATSEICRADIYGKPNKSSARPVCDAHTPATEAA